VAAEPVSLATRRPRAAARAEAPPPPPPRAGEGYSRFVTMMKITLPLIAAVLVGLVVVWPQFRDVREGFVIEITKLKNSIGGGQEVANARFTGTDQRGRPYTVIADSAAQVDGHPDLIGLEHPKADVTMQGGAWVASSAESGRFRRDDQILDLVGGVNLFHDQGFEMHSPSARLDLKRGTAEGDEKVDGHGPTGTISAEGFRVLDNGARVFFTGPARLVLRPDPQAATR
jgi:lipopolysaccharide export system protein LptC